MNIKICTIFTGGTIGSVLDESGYIGPKDGVPFRLLQLYQEKFGNNIEFVVMEPYRILSENLAADNLMKLKLSIQEALTQQDIQGIIVTHGTDTLQYSAAVLGYLFGDSPVPIVLVSSNYVLDDERANGLVNFQYAIKFINEKCGNGVFVSYCNEGECPTIHRATRLQPPVPYSDYVSSVQNTWYGRFEQGKYITNSYYNRSDGPVLKNSQSAMFEDLNDVRLDDKSGQILWIRPYVGMQYPEITAETKVILHGSFHSGTICVDENLKQFARAAKDRGVPFYLTGLSVGENAYESVKEYVESDIIPLYTSAEIAQYCKLWLAISNGLDIQRIMGQSVAEDWVI